MYWDRVNISPDVDAFNSWLNLDCHTNKLVVTFRAPKLWELIRSSTGDVMIKKITNDLLDKHFMSLIYLQFRISFSIPSRSLLINVQTLSKTNTAPTKLWGSPTGNGRLTNGFSFRWKLCERVGMLQTTCKDLTSIAIYSRCGHKPWWS